MFTVIWTNIQWNEAFIWPKADTGVMNLEQKLPPTWWAEKFLLAIHNLKLEMVVCRSVNVFQTFWFFNGLGISCSKAKVYSWSRAAVLDDTRDKDGRQLVQ